MTTSGVVALIQAVGRERKHLAQLATIAEERGDATPAVLSLMRSAIDDLDDAKLQLMHQVTVRA